MRVYYFIDRFQFLFGSIVTEILGSVVCKKKSIEISIFKMHISFFRIIEVHTLRKRGPCHVTEA